jgi:hypothetical protein
VILWKPGIDALGLAKPDRHFHPLDDRIVSLGLHRKIDDALGWDVVVEAWWGPA